MKEYQKRKTKVLKAIRWRRIKENKCPWIVFALSFLIPITSLILKCIFSCPECSFIYKITTWLENISYGYFSGFIVYLLISFCPETKKVIETKDSIYFQLHLIWSQLDSLYHKFTPEGCKIDYRICQTLLYNFLVKDARITDFNDKEQLLKDPVVNERNYCFVKNNLSYLNQNIDKLITAYGRDMNNDEVELLFDLSKLETELIESLNAEGINYKEKGLEMFIDKFSTKAYIRFRHIYYSYSFYKFWVSENP